MNKIVTFGEIMGRLAPEGFLRLPQVLPGRLEFTFGGAEANVAASIARLGGRAAYVTALPENPLGEACEAFLRSLGVDTRGVVWKKNARFGLYFVETGANQRPGNVVYDRAESALATTPPDAYAWPEIFRDAAWLHVSGITPAVSECAARATLDAIRAASKAGLSVSCDLNFRKKLWNWEATLPPRELAEKTLRGILPYVDLVIANEEDAADVLGIHPENTDVESGRLDIANYPRVAAEIARQFEKVSRVAITLRESISASHNNWGAMLYDAETETACFAPMKAGVYRPYEIRNMVDRVGGGDSFAAGLIFALCTPELRDPETAVAFAAAASCLAHSIKGDVNYTSRREVETLMGGSGSGRVVR